MSIEARYYDGKSAKALEVSLVLTDRGLSIRQGSGEEIALWDYDRIRDETHPPVPDELTLSFSAEDNARIIVEDAAFTADLTRLCPRIRKRRQGKPGWWKPVAGWTAGVLISGTLFFVYGLPLLANGIANLIPIETRARIGEEVEAAIIKRFTVAKKEGDTTDKDPVCRNETGQQALEALLARYLGQSDTDIPAIKITVLQSKVPNAFALPGGRMVIMSSLIDMAEHPNALAGVIAHEFGHIEGTHPMSLFVTNVGIAALFSVAFGDVSGGTILAAVGQYAAGAAYSRDFENVADTRSIELMNGLGYDIAPVIPLFEKLGEKTPELGVLSVFSSHPDMQERVAALGAAKSTGTGKAFNDREWRAIQIMCKGSV